MTQTALESSSLPPPPRPATARIRRRAWAEPAVRFWWVLALALLVLAPLAGWPQFSRWQTLSRLSEQPPTAATILRTDREAVQGRPVLPGQAVLVAVGQGEGRREVWGTLDTWEVGPRPRTGETIDVRLDPQNPDVWAVVHSVPPVWTGLATGLIIAGVAVVPFLVAVLLRRRVMRVWTAGRAAEAAVLGRQQTALAPGAYAVRCAWAEGDDRSVFSVFVPKSAAGDETVVVLSPSGGGGKRVAAKWFE